MVRLASRILQSRRIGFALAAIIGGSQASVTHAAEPCADILPRLSTMQVAHPVQAMDLVRLRDIGMNDLSLPGAPPVTLSPNGKEIAFQLRQADPERNSYCQALVVMAVRGNARPRIIDAGGELVTFVISDLRGNVVPTGTPDVITPKWSPDGRWIAYRKRVSGRTRLWLVQSDGGGAHALTALDNDVEQFAWTTDGSKLIVSTHGYEAANDLITQRGRAGYLYDDRIVPAAGARPFPATNTAVAHVAIIVATGAIQAASQAEELLLIPDAAARPARADHFVSSADDRSIAWTERQNAALPLAPTDLWVQIRKHAPIHCSAAACRGPVVGLWWAPGGRELWFLRRSGWANEAYSFYRWSPGTPPRLSFSTKDVLTDCQPAGADLLCDRDASLAPRRIVIIAPRSGKERTVFDPNPDFGCLQLGSVQRLHWTTDIGMPVFGDLVLPVNYQKGRRYPLIVVQYRTRGFLRGGVGDEYPIQAFAGRGYAVLSIERSDFVAEATAPADDHRSSIEFQKADIANWADRRNNLSEIRKGVALVEQLGIADPEKVGITGMSDGSTSATFALNNSQMFEAAALSTCCMDPTTALLGGPGWAKHAAEEGYPLPSAIAPDFWHPMSLAMNVDHIDVPILMQLSDDEYELGLESFAAMKDRRLPVELRIFPGEQHVKWQPAHRLAIYQRALDWFDFWLRGLVRPAPGLIDQYNSWNEMRESWQRSRTVIRSHPADLSIPH